MFRPLSDALNEDTPPRVVDFFRTVVDLHLHDARAMLRLPLADAGIEAGCNFSCANTLLAVIAGASAVFYDENDRRRGRGNLFIACAKEFYPWDTEPDFGVRTPKTGAKHLYFAFRNPLAHTMGHGAIRPRSISRRLGAGLHEMELEAIEMAESRPSSWLSEAATLTESAGRLNLAVEPFYWGARNARANVPQHEPPQGGGSLSIAKTRVIAARASSSPWYKS